MDTWDFGVPGLDLKGINRIQDQIIIFIFVLPL